MSFWLSTNLRAYVPHPSLKLGRICRDRFGGLSKPTIQPTQLLPGMWQLWVNHKISVVLTEKQATYSRGTCVYDHCGKRMNRHNFKKHVQDLHPGMPVGERVVGLM